MPPPQPCKPPTTMHTPCNHACPHPPCNHAHTPGNHARPPATMHAPRQPRTPPPPCGQTDTCKNNLRKLRLRAVKNTVNICVSLRIRMRISMGPVDLLTRRNKCKYFLNYCMGLIILPDTHRASHQIYLCDLVDNIFCPI